eukprot:CAMPEP_0206287840 /NCGR_PEP_ID=MMETSP0106_2-20121207/1310_1 /ASSEMBLY_ACC=CAM_ASM_000206 /TAXON_ID=81532 /ORGANISM="Acanthoeca-like sp., Strain 10tr" /LENGTH=162 /DNA_ID=CAMNT_0053718379 /DNA_START=50 /DNA_END=538 /DNA_ORIENTATION=-
MTVLTTKAPTPGTASLPQIMGHGSRVSLISADLPRRLPGRLQIAKKEEHFEGAENEAENEQCTVEPRLVVRNLLPEAERFPLAGVGVLDHGVVVPPRGDHQRPVLERRNVDRHGGREGRPHIGAKRGCRLIELDLNVVQQVLMLCKSDWQRVKDKREPIRHL